MPDQDEKRNVCARSIDVNAKTVEEAIEQGLAQLNLTHEQVEIEVIKEGKRGVFGLGSEEAQVRLTPKPQPLDKPSKVDAVSFSSEETVTLEEKTVPETDSAVAEMPSATAQTPDQAEDVEAIAVELLSNLLKYMGIQAHVTARLAADLVEPGEDSPIVLDITGSDLGILIGRRSETLRALQYMIRLMVGKQISRWYPIIIDVESYRVRRRRSLHQLAEKMAERAIANGRKVVLEAMPAYERRIIHLALRDHPQVFTKSVGSDDNRKVTIIPR